ncbi:hypothetical protein M9458_024119, partial [Cirrhinus mrigala]
LWCSNVQKALFEEEEKVKNLSQKVKILEKTNNHLRDKAKRETKEPVQSFKQLHEAEPELPHPQQDTTQDQKPTLRKILPKKLKN